MIKTNKPYVKKYENGILVNQITKENPYLFAFKLNPFKYRMWIKARNKYFTGREITK